MAEVDFILVIPGLLTPRIVNTRLPADPYKIASPNVQSLHGGEDARTG
jgi:hypothetical protein